MLDTERSQDTAAGSKREPTSYPVGWEDLVRAEKAPGERVVVVPDDGSDPLRTLAWHLTEAASDASASPLGPTVARALGRMTESVLESAGGTARLADALVRAADGLPSALDASDAAAAEAVGEAKRMIGRIPAAEAVLLDGQGPFRIAVRLLRRERRAPRSRLLSEIRDLTEAVRERLRADDALAPNAGAPERLSAGLGDAGVLLDADVLSSVLPTRKGSKRLEPERRARLERTGAQLEKALATIPAEPEVVVAAPTGSSAEREGAERVRTFHAPLASAAELFDELAAERVPLVRAVRSARMELDSGWSDPARLTALEGLDWQGFHTDEMALLPSVVALETGNRVRGEHLGGLSRLLRSGRPVTALVTETLDDLHRDESWDAVAGFHPGIGYLAVAHREAFVLQASAIRPEHLAAGLVACARRLEPAVVLVTVPRDGAGAGDRPALAAALAGRATPLLRYDPAAGETWAERFDLSGNPQPEATWPEVGGEPWTFVHFAACESALHHHVFGAAAQIDDERFLPVAEWLSATAEIRGRRIPVIEAAMASGERRAVIVARPAAFATLDRMRAWRILQELAGFHNEHARRAAERARAEAEEKAAAERAALETVHAEALERARLEAASEAVDRIVAALLGQAAAGPLPAFAPPPAPAVEAPVAAAVPEVAPEVEEEEEFLEEPWIDSALCTTCNECTNLNGKMFQYNANKQAVLTDAGAGTFEDLVKAAEKCPARCIHTGTPPENDSAVTDDLRARAAKFR